MCEGRLRQAWLLGKPRLRFQYFITPHLHIAINASTQDTYYTPFVIIQVNDCIKLNNERLKGNYAEFGVELKQRLGAAAEIDFENNSFTYEQFVKANNNESLTSYWYVVELN